ncbi:hypothetical protein Syun_007805 [Stephania yunnanensis]|uniref:B box-type domain-containing protein n=1 Tax=Stephania yunnanensis TaxID=152371 RepID=A0AAP0L173_9MAGN
MDPKEEEEEQQQQQRLCDFCGASTAVLYCRADSAKLCFACDHQVHSTNPLFKNHTRSQLCDSCDANPSSIHCFTHNTVLCQNCDWARHGRTSSGSAKHDRRPIEGFNGCPSAIELFSFLGFQDLGKKSVFGGGVLDLQGVWETPPIFSIDDLIASSTSEEECSGLNLQTVGIPPLPKNRNTSCGKYKDEMIHQLHDMSKVENSLNNGFEDVEALLGFQAFASVPNFEPGCTDFNCFEGLLIAVVALEFTGAVMELLLPSFINDQENNKQLFMHTDTDTPYKASSIQWNGKCSDTMDDTQSRGHHEERLVPPEKLSDAGEGGLHPLALHEEESKSPIRKESLPVIPKSTPRYLTNHNRDLSLSRYKEKKKTRRLNGVEARTEAQAQVQILASRMLTYGSRSRSRSRFVGRAVADWRGGTANAGECRRRPTGRARDGESRTAGGRGRTGGAAVVTGEREMTKERPRGGVEGGREAVCREAAVLREAERWCLGRQRE